MDVVSCDMGEDDPFADVHSDTNLQGLIADIIPETERCNAQEYYVNGDDDLSTCNDTEDEKWDEDFISQLGQPTEDSEEMQESETEADVDVQTESLEAKITTLKDAIIALEDVQSFLESHGHMSTSMMYIGPAVDALTALHIASMRQSTLHDYFQPSS